MPVPASSADAGPNGNAITPLLREFYGSLNGERYLGPAISLDFQVDGMTCQYTSNALLCMNPVETDPAQRFFLAPLGQKLGVSEPPDPNIESSSPFIINGYHIYPAFMAVYNVMHGETRIGPPLTNVIYNEQEGRIEQYFQNAGFYIRLNDPDAHVELLPYGYYVCKSCAGPSQMQQPMAIPQATAAPDVVISNHIDQLGGAQIFGQPISQTFIAQDGDLEQVYETVAVYSSSQQPGLVRFRPLPLALGMHQDIPGPQQYDRQNNMIFYATHGDQGFHVPVFFDEFILEHGGVTYSGQPISEPFEPPGQPGIARQCFANYCLDYYATAPAGQNVRLARLGSAYLQQLGSGPSAPSQMLQVMVSELLPQPASTESQVLTVMVFQRSNSQPVPNVEATATLTTRDGTEHVFRSPLTNSNGTANIIIPPLPNVKHGEMVTYQVCVQQAGAQPICQFDSYLIWDLN